MPAPKKYPDELCDRAVRLVFQVREESGQRQGAVARVAGRLGVNRETLRNWVRQAGVDAGKRAGTSTADAQRIAELEREVRELRRANDSLGDLAHSTKPQRRDLHLHVTEPTISTRSCGTPVKPM